METAKQNGKVHPESSFGSLLGNLRNEVNGSLELSSRILLHANKFLPIRTEESDNKPIPELPESSCMLETIQLDVIKLRASNEQLITVLKHFDVLLGV